MIPLARVALHTGEILIARRRDGAIGYWKKGHLQTLLDANGQTLDVLGAAAVDHVAKAGPERVLVLGYGGGGISTMLHTLNMQVVSVDLDACARGLATRFFGASPKSQVVTADAAAFVRESAPAAFEAVVVDFQDFASTPAAYLSGDFWKGVVRLLSPGGAVVMKANPSVQIGLDADAWRAAPGLAGLSAAFIFGPTPSGSRLVLIAPSSLAERASPASAKAALRALATVS